MLIEFDDYPIHQTSLPLGQTGSGNPNQYDRFWFNGFREDLIFGVAFCSYPNKAIMDGAFSVVRDGRQTSVFASGRMNRDPVDTHMGPISIEIVEPMRVNRVVVDAPEQGIRADLTYTATTQAIQEAHQRTLAGNRLLMDNTRATQWGRWTGWIEVDGHRVSLGEGCAATKDRSWGVRASAIPDGAFDMPDPFLFLWAPIHFPDEYFHFLTFERADGWQWVHDAMRVPPTSTGGDLVRFRHVDHEIDWAPGKRRARHATLVPHPLDGTAEPMTLEPLATFQMRGIGYSHPEWGHGKWHGELAVGGESVVIDELDPLAPENLHVQQLVRATWGDRVGIGVLEQIAIGPLPRYGFNEFLDGAE
ncbi:hypothetical protein [Gordonia rhizosphera]|uniref:AttH domain-containing protein n=1 Tax=Gordonia rhizosphera NBRC 16068 TaxID=1108045 RepID=K6WCF7_9ACTN|nr:hypothetical protein [Gordonia rhizosphera]GAB91416.1 hypothetical protein GORHZ_131_00030 [Gordonia rhizosphera NBRC 16068]